MGSDTPFFSIKLVERLHTRRLPFPLFARREVSWQRICEAGDPIDGHALSAHPLYAEENERMSWVSFLLSVLEKESGTLPPDDASTLLAQSGFDLIIGWTTEPTRPEYLALVHRWSAAMVGRESRVTI